MTCGDRALLWGYAANGDGSDGDACDGGSSAGSSELGRERAVHPGVQARAVGQMLLCQDLTSGVST